MIGSTRGLLRSCICLLVFSFATTLSAADDDGFKPIFDGKTLEGWKAADMSYWSVEDGAITGKITKEHPCDVNQYLIWQGGELADFELKMKFRMESEADINGGYQFRSEEMPNHDVKGYQVDTDTRGGWLVRLYDEHGRHQLALRGQHADISADGKITHTVIKAALPDQNFKLKEFNEFHLVCKGEKLSLSVNGQLMAEVVDNDPKQQDSKGILALQLHSNPVMITQFKDLRLKRLAARPTKSSK